MSDYAWIIDKDYLMDSGSEWSEAGLIGPSDAQGYSKQELLSAYDHHHQFRMYDDDDELYYTGTLFWNGDSEPSEQYLYGPLGDFGMPNAGATSIDYTGKPEWNCG